MIAVDIMGGDNAPQALIEGAYNAAKRGIPVKLFGDIAIIEPLLEKLSESEGESWQDLPIGLAHCLEIIGMDEEPSRSVVAKKDSSLVRAMHAVRDGYASAVVSAGNTGAVLVAGTLILERVRGVLRPAIGGNIPTPHGDFFCIDLGANTDCKPEYLEQFAIMGHAFISLTKNIDAPRIGLLSNGAEPYKGSASVKAAYELLFESAGINFIGNIEARDLFNGSIDVLVCDGFVGNVLLKSIQGTSRAMVYWIDQERKASWLYSVGLFLSKGLFKSIKTKIDYAQKGGALLLGVKHPVVVAHGASNALAIENAIAYAHEVTSEGLIAQFNEELEALLMSSKEIKAFEAAQQDTSYKTPSSKEIQRQ